MNQLFPIEPSELDYLAKRDEKLAQAIRIIGPLERTMHPDAFTGLAYAICGQQVSAAAHKSVWARFNASFPIKDPAHIATLDPMAIKSCGLSLRKVNYIQKIATLFSNKELVEKDLRDMDDDELRQRLIQLPGVGHWTVDMLLIFTFQRKNILSFGDLAIHKGLRMLYGWEDITPDIFRSHHEIFTPFASIASLYLWEIVEGKYNHWKDPRPPKTPRQKQSIDKSI